MTESEDHITYIKRKEDKTIKLFEQQMFNGRIFSDTIDTEFEDLKKSTGTISDFTHSEKLMTVESNTNTSQQTKSTKDQSAHKNKVKLDEVKQ